MLKASTLATNYISSLCLCIIGIFSKYRSYMLVCQDLACAAFEGLNAIIKHVNNPSDCTSAERCVQAFLFDLYTSALYLKSKYSDSFSATYTKMKQTHDTNITPSVSNLLWDPHFMMDYFNDVKSLPDAMLVKQLNENAKHRYNFVCNAVLNICGSQATDR